MRQGFCHVGDILKSFLPNLLLGRITCDEKVKWGLNNMSSILHYASEKIYFDMDWNSKRNSTIKKNFELGYSYYEVKILLKKQSKVILSMRQLKRILFFMDLYQRKNYLDINVVLDVIFQELSEGNCLLGYRQMQKILQWKYDFVTDRKATRLVLKHLDLEGVHLRIIKRFKRRMHESRGPNDILHLDGYNKLRPYGIVIQEAIYGYYRKILWGKVCRTNDDPFDIAVYFIGNVKGNVYRLPRRVRGYRVAENLKAQVSNDLAVGITWANIMQLRVFYKGSQHQIRKLRGDETTFKNVLLHFGQSF